MEDFIIYLFLSIVLIILVLILQNYRHKLSTESEETNDAAEAGRPPAGLRQRPVDMGGGDGIRNRRAIANRNARARMRAAQAQQHRDSESEGEGGEDEELATAPSGKIGKKKLAKLQMKAEKKAMREAEEREREEKKERDEKRMEERRKIEAREEEEERQREEEKRLKREEEERKEREEYERLKAEFEIEAEGFDEAEEDLEHQSNLLRQFIDHIKRNKVVVLEDVAAIFNLKTQAVIDRITELLKEGTLTGVIDDRGKFIYVSRGEMQEVVNFIRRRGRVSIADLAEASSTLISLTPEEA